MSLTRDYKKTVTERVKRDPDFAQAMFREATTLLINGESEAARVILRDLINATMGFEKLATTTALPSKSLHRMLSPRGNPTMDSLASILGAIEKKFKVKAEVHTVRMA